MYSGQQQQQLPYQQPPYQQPPYQQQHPHSNQQYPNQSHVGATFTPGGTDDFSMPELVSPAPQRSAPEEFHEIQGRLQHMELGADEVRPLSVQSTNYHNGDVLRTPSMGLRGETPQIPSPAMGSGTFQGQPQRGPGGSSHQSTVSDAPSFSPFPKLHPRPPNVPPSSDEKLQILETAKSRVIASNDPEIQLTWAQDTLSFVEIASQNETRNAMDESRPATPRVEHELKQEAVNIIGFLADQYHPKAQFLRGMWLEFGKFGTRKDLRESYRCYARAAERGYSRAEYRMGMQFESSNDVTKAIQHYNLGVDAHDAASSYRIGMMTLMGQHGQTQDFHRGVDLIKYSADHADENAPQGAYIYGMLLARELPQVSIPDYTLSTDIRQARTYIEKAAFLGFAKAQTKLGRAYEHGELGCSFDAALSLHYNNLAARQGDEDAEMAISKWFLSGQEGIFAKNEQMAYLYAKRAARSGLATAEFAMGYFYEVGIHVSVDLKEAQRWYRKAAENGNSDAAARVEGISRSKTLSRKDHERIAVAKVRQQRAADQDPRAASRMGAPNGPPIPMPQPTPQPTNAIYPPAGAPYQPVHASYPPGQPPGGPGYPPAGSPYPPAGNAYPPQNSQSPRYGPASPYGAYGPGAPGAQPNVHPSPGPGPAGYGSPPLGPQAPGGRVPQQSNGYPQRGSSTPSAVPNRRPVGGGPSPAPPPGSDFGFQAPPAQQSQRVDYSGSGHRPPPTSRPDYPSNPSSPVDAHGSISKPGPRTNTGSGRPAQQAQAPPRQQQAAPRQASAQQARPPQQQQQQKPPSAKPSRPQQQQQGPSTFDEMGVPKVKDKSDCVIM